MSLSWMLKPSSRCSVLMALVMALTSAQAQAWEHRVTAGSKTAQTGFVASLGGPVVFLFGGGLAYDTLSNGHYKHTVLPGIVLMGAGAGAMLVARR